MNHLNKKVFTVIALISIIIISLTVGVHVNLAKAQSPDTQTLIIYNPTQNATYINDLQVSFISSFYNGTRGLDGWFIIDNSSKREARSWGVDSEKYTHFDDTVYFSNFNFGNGTTHQITLGVTISGYGPGADIVSESSAPILFTAYIIFPQPSKSLAPKRNLQHKRHYSKCDAQRPIVIST